MKPSDKQDRADVFPFNGLKFKILQEGGSTIIQNKFLIQGNLKSWPNLHKDLLGSLMFINKVLHGS